MANVCSAIRPIYSSITFLNRDRRGKKNNIFAHSFNNLDANNIRRNEKMPAVYWRASKNWLAQN
jgi:hypothetical protein